MNKFYFRFRIFLMAFALGLAGFWFIDGARNGLVEPTVNLPKASSASVFEIITRQEWKGFVAVRRGCGATNKYGGYGGVIAYENSAFRGVSLDYFAHEKVKKAK